MVDVHKMTLLGSSLFQLRKHITTTQTCRAGTGILNGSSSINKSDCEEGSFLTHVRSRAVATLVTTSLIKTPTPDVWWQRPRMTSLPNSKTHQRDAPMHQEWVNKPRFYGTNLQDPSGMLTRQYIINPQFISREYQSTCCLGFIWGWHSRWSSMFSGWGPIAHHSDPCSLAFRAPNTWPGGPQSTSGQWLTKDGPSWPG